MTETFDQLVSGDHPLAGAVTRRGEDRLLTASPEPDARHAGRRRRPRSSWAQYRVPIALGVLNGILLCVVALTYVALSAGVPT